MDKFKNKLSFDFKTNQRMIKAISFIDSFKGKWNVIEQKESVYLKELQKAITFKSVSSSIDTRLPIDEIKELIHNVDANSLKIKDQQEALGYYDAFKRICENYLDIELSKSSIQQIHEQIFKYNTKNNGYRKDDKGFSSRVIANYPGGGQKVALNSTAPHFIGNETSDLIDWINYQLESGEMHPLLVTSVFTYEFLSIHPFQDGNGRLSRLLTLLLLLKYDYSFIQYVSFESLIEENKTKYYESLMAGQKDRYSYSERIDKWIFFFLESLKTLTLNLERKCNISSRPKTGYLNDRQKKVRAIIEQEQPTKLADLIHMMPDVSINTLKKDLQHMKSEHVIYSIGKNKGTVYLTKGR